jgi:hypothetical protein
MPKPESKKLTTAAEVIGAIGHARVQQLTGKSYKRVWGWGAAGSIPPRYFLPMVLELAKTGHSAPASLWRQEIPRNKEALLWVLARKLSAA